MKTRTLFASVIAVALLLAIAGSLAGGSGTSGVAFAQDATPVATTAPQATPVVQAAQPVEREDNGFPWGLLGLLGLAGLAGMRRREEPVVRQEPVRVAPKVGVYEDRK